MSKIIGSLKSKTAWWSLALVVIGVLQDNMDLITQIIGADNVGKFVTAAGVVTYLLRLVTKAPVEDKA